MIDATETVVLQIIQLMEGAKIAMESLRTEKSNGWDARALSIAITELETAQLWLANARPEDI